MFDDDGKAVKPSRDPRADSIALVMVHIGLGNSNSRRSLAMWENYSNNKGYQFVVQKENTLGRDAVWMKMVAIKRIIEENLEGGKIEWIL